MNILIVHNHYNVRGGEESVVDMQCRLFEEQGHRVFTYFRHYSEIKRWRGGKLRSLITSIYNRQAAHEVEQLVKEHAIEVAFVHNLFPIISPSVLPVLKRHGVRTIWIAHNYRLICPSALCYTKGEVCERCGKGTRELHCVLNRCEGSIAGSIGYAVRSFSARVSGLIRKNVDTYVVLTNFQREKFIEYGFDSEKIAVVGNSTTFPILPEAENSQERNGKVLFVGRISEEKGMKQLFEAARQLPHVPFVIAGTGELLPSWGGVPPNMTLLGRVEREELVALYRSCSMLVITSIWYETFLLGSVEAAFSLCPVIAPNIGCFVDRVVHNKTGLLFNSIEELVAQIELLRTDRTLAQRLARESQAESIALFSTASYVAQLEKLMQ